MALKDKLFYWCCGGWIVDAVSAIFKTGNHHDDKGESPNRLTYRCNASNFCEHMRNVAGVGLFCGREKTGVHVDCVWAAKYDESK